MLLCPLRPAITHPCSLGIQGHSQTGWIPLLFTHRSLPVNNFSLPLPLTPRAAAGRDVDGGGVTREGGWGGGGCVLLSLCLKQVSPKYTKQFSYLWTVERIAALFLRFLGVKGNMRLGPTNFRTFIRYYSTILPST